MDTLRFTLYPSRFRSLAIMLCLAAGSYSAMTLADHHLLELANDIQPNDIMTGTLGSGDEANFYYLVRIPENGVLRAYTQGEVDTYGELLYSDNDSPILTANGGGEDDNFLIESRVTQRDYIIRVAGATPFETGAFNIVTEFIGDSETTSDDLYTDQEKAALVISSSGLTTDASIAIGSFLEGSSTRSKTFSAGDSVVIQGTVNPDSADLGKAAEIYIVLRTGADSWTVRDEDGVFVPWEMGRRKTLEPAYTIDSLSDSESVLVYSGSLVANEHRIFIGYALVDSKPVTFNIMPYRLTVSE